jgi:hypothetical protein
LRVPRLALPLTLTLLTLLTLLALLPRAAGIREGPPRLLEARRGLREVPVGLDLIGGALERVAESLEGVLGHRRLTLGDRLRGVPQRLARGAARLGGLRLERREGRRRVPPLLGRHPVQLLPEALEIVGRGLRVAVLVRVWFAGSRPRQRTVERRERGRPLLVPGIQLRVERRLDGPESGEVGLEIVGVRPQLDGQVPQLGGKSCPRIVRLRAFGLQLLGDLLDLRRLLLCLVAGRASLGDGRVLRVREDRQRHDQKRGHEGDRRRST